MKEHKDLKSISDEISYVYQIGEGGDSSIFWDDEHFYRYHAFGNIKADVRTIVFSTEFMFKFRKYFLEQGVFSYMKQERKEEVFDITICELIQYHLNDPVGFLYDLIQLGKENK